MAHKPAKEFFIPTQLKLTPVDGVVLGEPSYPDPDEQKVEWSDMKLLTYGGRIEIGVPVEVLSGRSGVLKLSGTLSFQGCTEYQCLPPKNQAVTLLLEAF